MGRQQRVNAPGLVHHDLNRRAMRWPRLKKNDDYLAFERSSMDPSMNRDRNVCAGHFSGVYPWRTPTGTPGSAVACGWTSPSPHADGRERTGTILSDAFSSYRRVVFARVFFTVRFQVSQVLLRYTCSTCLKMAGGLYHESWAHK